MPTKYFRVGVTRTLVSDVYIVSLSGKEPGRKDIGSAIEHTLDDLDWSDEKEKPDVDFVEEIDAKTCNEYDSWVAGENRFAEQDDFEPIKEEPIKPDPNQKTLF